MTPIEIKSFLAGKVASARDEYVKDLEAMTEEDLGKSPGGAARSPFDFSYEVAFINRRIAKRLRGETPEPFKFEGWIKAPDELRSKPAIIDSLRTSMDEVLEAWNALPEDEMTKKIPMPSGESTPVDFVYMCAAHSSYHDAQLNYLQSISGDTEVHWG